MSDSIVLNMADNSQLSFHLLGDFTLKVQLGGTWRLRGGRLHN